MDRFHEPKRNAGLAVVMEQSYQPPSCQSSTHGEQTATEWTHYVAYMLLGPLSLFLVVWLAVACWVVASHAEHWGVSLHCKAGSLSTREALRRAPPQWGLLLRPLRWWKVRIKNNTGRQVRLQLHSCYAPLEAKLKPAVYALQFLAWHCGNLVTVAGYRAAKRTDNCEGINVYLFWSGLCMFCVFSLSLFWQYFVDAVRLEGPSNEAMLERKWITLGAAKGSEQVVFGSLMFNQYIACVEGDFGQHFELRGPVPAFDGHDLDWVEPPTEWPAGAPNPFDIERANTARTEISRLPSAAQTEVEPRQTVVDTGRDATPDDASGLDVAAQVEQLFKPESAAQPEVSSALMAQPTAGDPGQVQPHPGTVVASASKDTAPDDASGLDSAALAKQAEQLPSLPEGSAASTGQAGRWQPHPGTVAASKDTAPDVASGLDSAALAKQAAQLPSLLGGSAASTGQEGAGRGQVQSRLSSVVSARKDTTADEAARLDRLDRLDAQAEQSPFKLESAAQPESIKAATATALRTQSQLSLDLSRLLLEEELDQQKRVESLVGLLQPESGAAHTTKHKPARALAKLAAGDAKLRDCIVNAKAVLPLVALLELPSGTSDSTKGQAAAALANLALDDRHRVRVAFISTSALVALLHPSSGASDDTKEQAAMAIENLAVDDAMRQVVGAGMSISAPLIAMLQLSSGASDRSKQLAARVLSSFAAYPSFRRQVVNAGAIAPLAALLQPSSGASDSTKQTAGRVLSKLTEEACREQIVEAGAIAKLIALLHQSLGASDSLKQIAAGVLLNLADNIILRDRIVDAGAIAPLVALLQPSSGAADGTKQMAMRVLSELAEKESSVRERIVEAGAIAPLIVLLQQSLGTSESTTQAAAGVLSHLAKDMNLVNRIVDAGAIAALVALLQPSSGAPNGTKRRALEVLASLAAYNAKSQERVADAGTIEALVALLQPSSGASGDTKQGAVKVLLVLADNTKCQKRIADGSTIASLAALLLSSSGSSDSTKHSVAKVLAILSATSAELRDSIVNAGAIKPLATLLQRSTATHSDYMDTLWHAATVIANLAVSDTKCHEHIAAAGAIAPLVALLQLHFPDNLQAQAARTLTHIASADAKLGACIVEAGAITPLVELLQPSWGSFRDYYRTATGNNKALIDRRQWAARALANLAADNAECSELIADAGAITPLIALLQASSDSVDHFYKRTASALSTTAADNALIDRKQWAASALANLAAGSAKRSELIADAGAITPLVALLQTFSNTADDMKRQAARALANLAAASAKCQERIADAGATKLVAQLQPSSDASADQLVAPSGSQPGR